MTSDPRLKEFFAACNNVLLGKEREIRLAVTCILARGHLLVEDIPGVGKTTLVHALAQGLGLGHVRIQFTSDLLPADIVGGLIFDESTRQFVLRRGPIFSHFVLADELNRATPKTQSALLQAMEERTVSIDDESHPLPDPFFVFATQNPFEQAGTFPLPESQIDRFLMRLSLGYPDREAEKKLLAGEERRRLIAKMPAFYDAASVIGLQDRAGAVHVSEPIVDYVEDLLEASRAGARRGGLSPRAGRALIAAARAWAFLEGRDMTLPEDVQAVAASVIGHRLHGQASRDGDALAKELLGAVPVR